MILFTFACVLAIILVIYWNLGPWLYRRPWALLAVGLVTSAFAVFIKAVPLILMSFPQLADNASVYEIAASSVDPTLIGLSGGLIASAFILKLQIMHAAEIAQAHDAVVRASEKQAHVTRSVEDLKLVAQSLTNEEFDARLKQIRAQKMDAIICAVDAEHDLQEKQVSGL